MLRVKLNTKDAIPSYRDLTDTISNISLNDDGKLVLEAVDNNVMVGDKIMFVREDCNGERLCSDFTKVVSTSSDTITIERFPDIILRTTPSIQEIRKSPKAYTLETVVFDFNGRHCFYTEDETCKAVENIKDYVRGNEEYNGNKRHCPGDYVIYNEKFLYQADAVNDNKYDFSDITYLNKSDAKLKLRNQYLCDTLGNGGTNWTRGTDSRGEFIQLLNCVVPVELNGSNNMNQLLWDNDGGTSLIASALPDSETGEYEHGVTEYSCEDERFYIIDGSGVTLHDNVYLYLAETDIKITNINIADFETNLYQKEILEQKFFFEKNRIIDYEKQIFYPVFGENGDKDVLSITYDIYLRERDISDNEWKILEDGLWNVPTDNVPSGGDLVEFAGFDEDDIYYQKKKVGMSFLRLSLYDSKDRRSQSLLGYFTMFLDSTELYRKYVKNKNKLHSDLRLGLSFSCANKYMSDKSSEGFYLYLFPSLLETQPKNGEWSIIYMKVEFNNAKYGKTVPFVTVPKEGYVEVDADGMKYIDMQTLFNDMYIELGIKYDSSKNRYIWRFNNGAEANNVIKLFEPKVNG